MAEPLEAVLTLERSALGAAILDTSGHQARIITEFVGERDWISPLNRSAFVAIRTLVARDCLPLEYNTVIGELQSMGVLEQYANGWSLVTSLTDGCVIEIPMTKRIRELRRLWAERKEAAVAQ